ncbi:o-succinylbenzoate synthase [Robiginitalea sp. M366]|uniref:o-succinylbenzoate synthase n=1 Tax=Robiginitalea aestuariiviva TaxID=3036903 RepID=UPI00240E8FEF|nr:o-succinylbenzoate synthase [Robiginitalea aestuariiviva]MDG1573070.1 o-succinylbenzoate synthase [Robiginitalea aestuariiviva]
MKARYCSHILSFKRPGGTSRGVLTQKETHFITLSRGEAFGIGECGLFRGLSADDRPGFEQRLAQVCREAATDPESLLEGLREWPSIRFGLEQALRSLQAQHPMELYSSAFLSGTPVPINGLIWMGEPAFMQSQIEARLAEGYRCLKLKIGALDFDTEFRLLQGLRQRFPEELLELRVDANGAFTPEQAPGRLEQLAALGLHSIEQPIRAGQWAAMAALCRETPLPIALDEELIGVWDLTRQEALLDEIRPQYIILKPSLVGGWAASEAWIRQAEARGIGWWVTSALESNIGLNAIAQWTATLKTDMPQGLGTGSLFTNNLDSPLRTGGGSLHYDGSQGWNMDQLMNLCI